MNRVVLVCAVVALVVFGGLLLVKNHGAKVVPYYVPQQHVLAAPPSATPKSLFLSDPPSLDQIKKDLSGKTVVINGKNHQFAGPDLNYMTILTANPGQDGGVVLDIQICADITIVEKTGLLGARTKYSHENVCGSMRVYYDRKNDLWTYRMAENIDLQKMITPNAKAPPSNTQVWRYTR